MLPKVTTIPDDRIILPGARVYTPPQSLGDLFAYTDTKLRIDAEIAAHVRRNRAKLQPKRRYNRYGGLHILRLGRLTLQWSWRVK